MARSSRGVVTLRPHRPRLDLPWHYFASYLIASGLDIKTVQKRMRHASTKTTLDVYGHLFADSDESTRDAVSAACASRPQQKGSGGLRAV